jgi:hypothetical protein
LLGVGHIERTGIEPGPRAAVEQVDNTVKAPSFLAANPNAKAGSVTLANRAKLKIMKVDRT